MAGPAVLVCALFFTGCKKELSDNQAGGSAMAETVASRAADCTEGITKVCHDHILRFADQAHFQQVYDCLQAAYDAHYQAVLDQYGNMNDEDFNNQLDNMGFDEDQPLIDFETALGFSSWRAHWRAVEDVWLANGADLNNDPTEHNVVDDPVLEAMLSQEGLVAVGGVLHWIDPDGEWVYIENWSCADAEALVNGTYEGATNRPLKSRTGTCGDCMGHVIDQNAYEPADNRKAKWRHEHAFDPAHSYVGIRLVQKLYKKRMGLVWGRWRGKTQTVWSSVGYTDDDPFLVPPCPRKAWLEERTSRHWRIVLFRSTVPQGTSPTYCMPDCIPEAR